MLLEAVLVEELPRVLFQVERDLRASPEILAVIFPHTERTVSRTLPAVLLVVVVLGADADLVRDQVDRIKTDAELADERQVAALVAGHGLDEVRGSRFRDGSEVSNQVRLGHAH